MKPRCDQPDDAPDALNEPNMPTWEFLDDLESDGIINSTEGRKARIAEKLQKGGTAQQLPADSLQGLSVEELKKRLRQKGLSEEQRERLQTVLFDKYAESGRNF